jgi:hypothetical protein
VCVAYEVIGIVLSPVWAFVELLFLIPIIGAIIREIWDLIVEVVWRLAGVLDLVLDLVGIRLQKKMRVCIIVLSDKDAPQATDASLDAAIESAKQIYNEAADVSLIVSRIHTVLAPAPDAVLDSSCDVGAWGNDLWTPGSYYEYQATVRCWDSVGTRIIGYGAAVAVFVARKIEGTTAGCSLGPLSDYVVIEGPTGSCLAHELSHACGLWHVDDADNLANPTCGGTWLHGWQRAILRNSRHVTYI